jgi:hypothetical protein
MWGNTIGWILSAVVTAVAVVLAVIIWQSAQPTPPGEFARSAAVPLGAIKETATAAGLDGTDPTLNAGKFYRDAVAELDDKKGDKRLTYEALKKNNNDSAIEQAKQLKGIDLIVQGSKGGTMDLYRSNATTEDDIIGFASPVQSLDDLKLIGDTAIHIAALDYTAKDFVEAKTLARAAQILGYNLYKERIAFDELDAGESLIGSAESILVMIAEKEGDQSTISKQKALDAARVAEFKANIDPVVRVLRSLGEQTVEDHAGDFFAIAANPNADRIWRVEAIRRIGRLIFFATNKADQTRAPKFLAKLAADPTQDKVIQAAAARAAAITSYDNQAPR